MKAFKHYRPKNVDDATSVLNEFHGRARLLAGGTDLLGTLKDRIHPEYLGAVVDIKSIPGLSGLRESTAGLAIGSATRLADIAEDQVVREKYPLLAQAAPGSGIAPDSQTWLPLGAISARSPVAGTTGIRTTASIACARAGRVVTP